MEALCSGLIVYSDLKWSSLPALSCIPGKHCCVVFYRSAHPAGPGFRSAGLDTKEVVRFLVVTYEI